MPGILGLPPTTTLITIHAGTAGVTTIDIMIKDGLGHPLANAAPVEPS